MERQIKFLKDILFFYAPFNFLREFSFETQINQVIIPKIRQYQQENKIIEIQIANKKYFFLVDFLEWDSNYFKIPTYKIFTVLYPDNDFENLFLAIESFKKKILSKEKKVNIFVEIPSEDIFLIQAMNLANFRLIETRLTYFHSDLAKFENTRYKVRKAQESDIPNLRKTAKEAVNPYDRIHADVFFEKEIADNYLATYIKNAVKGFADFILVPNENNVPTKAFLAANILKVENLSNEKIGKITLSAASRECKGWNAKLTSETFYEIKKAGCKKIFMNTQSTNKAITHTWEKLGCKLAKATHILSFIKN